MSTHLDGAWKRNNFRIVADRPRVHAAVYLPDCPDGCARVAVLIPPTRIPEGYMLAGSKFGRVVGGEVRVRLLALDVPARPVDTTDVETVAPTRARYVVVMPPRAAEVDDEA